MRSYGDGLATGVTRESSYLNPEISRGRGLLEHSGPAAAWSAREENRFVEIETIETPSLGNRSYVLVAADGSAAVIDPQRDIDRVEAVIDERGLRVTHILETHLHADYVSGGLELSRRTGAAYVIPAGIAVGYGGIAAREGDEFRVGGLTLRAVHTPGHTPHHLSYVVNDGTRPVAVFSGGSMLYGTVGRTDLTSQDVTESLSRQQFHSVRRLAAELPAETEVHPTHGFGSFCSSASASGRKESTVARERLENLALLVRNEDEFVTTLLAGLTSFPRYYSEVPAINRQGPKPIDLSPAPLLRPDEIRHRIIRGEWVVDLRHRRAFAEHHLVGTINLEISESFSTYLGWTIPWGTPVTLVGDTADEVGEAQRQMARLGIDRPAGAASGGIETWAAGGERASYRTATFTELAEAQRVRPVLVIDVRRDDEWAVGHVGGAMHIPLHELESRLPDLPDAELWVYCASGYRAAMAASLLARTHRTVIAVDDEWSPTYAYVAAGGPFR
jgi:hydroxyacylglutathione hydrolase